MGWDYGDRLTSQYHELHYYIERHCQLHTICSPTIFFPLTPSPSLSLPLPSLPPRTTHLSQFDNLLPICMCLWVKLFICLLQFSTLGLGVSQCLHRLLHLLCLFFQSKDLGLCSSEKKKKTLVKQNLESMPDTLEFKRILTTMYIGHTRMHAHSVIHSILHCKPRLHIQEIEVLQTTLLVT